MRVICVRHAHSHGYGIQTGRRAQHGKLQGPKIYQKPSTSHSIASRNSLDGDKITATRKSVMLELGASFRGRQTAKLSYEASAEVHARTQVPLSRNESSAAPPLPSSPSLSFREGVCKEEPPRIFASLSISIAHLAG